MPGAPREFEIFAESSLAPPAAKYPIFRVLSESSVVLREKSLATACSVGGKARGLQVKVPSIFPFCAAYHDVFLEAVTRTFGTFSGVWLSLQEIVSDTFLRSLPGVLCPDGRVSAAVLCPSEHSCYSGSSTLPRVGSSIALGIHARATSPLPYTALWIYPEQRRAKEL